MSLTSKHELLGAKKRRFITLSVAETGHTFRIRSLTEKEKSEYEATMMSKAGAIDRERLMKAYRLMFIFCVVDDSGNPMFSDGDMEALEDVDAIDIAKVFNAAREHCGFDKGDIEEIIKNSSRVHVADSP